MTSLHKFCWWLIAVLIAFEVFLAGMHMHIVWNYSEHISSTVQMFHVNREGTLSSWFSSMQFFLMGMVLALIYVLEQDLDPSQGFVFVWLLSALGAVFLSADEGAAIHEWSGWLMKEAIDNAEEGSLIDGLSGFPSYYWSIIYLPVALPAAVFLGIFFWKALGPLRYLPIIGMIVFLLGAIVLDYVEGAYGSDDHTPWRVQFWGFDQVVDTALIEEVMEMFGVTLVLSGFLFHAARRGSEWLDIKNAWR